MLVSRNSKTCGRPQHLKEVVGQGTMGAGSVTSGQDAMDLEGAIDVLDWQNTTDARDALDAQCVFTNSSIATPHVQRLPCSLVSMLNDV